MNHYDQGSWLVFTSYLRFAHTSITILWFLARRAPSPWPSAWDLPWPVGRIVFGFASHKMGSTFHACVQSIVTIEYLWKPKTTYLECRLMNNRRGSSHVKALNVKNQSIKSIKYEKPLKFQKSDAKKCQLLESMCFLIDYIVLTHINVFEWINLKPSYMIYHICHHKQCYLLWELEVSFACGHVPIIGESPPQTDHAEISHSTC